MSWKNKKQPVVAQSSLQVEYHAMFQGTGELLWLKIILDVFGPLNIQ